MASTPTDDTTLSQIIESYRQAGFTADFGPESNATVRCGACETKVKADRVVMHSMRRLEGASDPADMLAVAAVTCPICQANGTLVLGYGPAGSDIDGDVLGALRDNRDDDVLPPDSAPDESTTGDEGGGSPSHSAPETDKGDTRGVPATDSEDEGEEGM